MFLESKNLKCKSIPFTLPQGIKKNKSKIEKLSLNLNKPNNDKIKNEKELYNYELEQNSENSDLTTEKTHSKIKFENILEKNRNFNKNKDNTKNKLIKENNNMRNIINENNYIKESKKDSNLELNLNKKGKNTNIDDLLKEYNSLVTENKKIKTNMILQQILVDEMKKELESFRKNNTKDSGIEANCINGDNKYDHKLKDNFDLIKELKDKNMKLTSENQILKEIINKNKDEINIKTNIIDNLYENIKQISTYLGKINFNEINNSLIHSETGILVIKFLEKMNNDNNGNFTIMDKINIINEFNDFLKSEIKILLNNMNKNKSNDKNFINIVNSENGLGSSIDDKEAKKLFETQYIDKNNIFKYKDYFKNNDKLEQPLLTKYQNNNRYMLSNTDFSTLHNSSNKIRIIKDKNRINIKKHFLKKDGILNKNSLKSKSNYSLNDSKENINAKVKEIKDIMNKNSGFDYPTDKSTNFKKNKIISIPKPKLQINDYSPIQIKENFKEFEYIPFNSNLNKIQNNLNYEPDYNNNKKKERNTNSNLEHILTDININNKNTKFDLEYIKLNAIFKNVNNSSNISRTKIKEIGNPLKKYDTVKNKNYLNNKYINSAPKFLKIKNLKTINGLANEVMKPSFLKTNLSLSINNDDKDKDKDKENCIFKHIKKYEIIKKKK